MIISQALLNHVVAMQATTLANIEHYDRVSDAKARVKRQRDVGAYDFSTQ
jgi:hypothetical protein